VKENRT